jgi:hypothetical protein
MTQKQKPLETLRERIEIGLRKVCGRVSPDRRAAVIVAMLVVFAALNIWVTARAIWSIGRGDVPHHRIEIPPMEIPDFTPEEGYTSPLRQDAENQFEQPLNSESHDTATIEQEQGER